MEDMTQVGMNDESDITENEEIQAETEAAAVEYLQESEDNSGQLNVLSAPPPLISGFSKKIRCLADAKSALSAAIRDYQRNRIDGARVKTLAYVVTAYAGLWKQATLEDIEKRLEALENEEVKKVA